MQPLFNLEGTRIKQENDTDSHSTSHSRQVFVLDLKVTKATKQSSVSPRRSKVKFLIDTASDIEFH